MQENEKKKYLFARLKKNFRHKKDNNPFQKNNDSKSNSSSPRANNRSRLVYILLSVFIAIAVIGWTIENFIYPPFRFASFLQTVSSFATLAFLYLTPVTNGGFSGPNDNS